MEGAWKDGGRYLHVPVASAARFRPTKARNREPPFFRRNSCGLILCECLRRIWNVLRSLFPFFCLLAYSFLGGLIFYSLEGSHVVEQRQWQLARVARVKNDSTRELLELYGSNCNSTPTHSQVIVFLEHFSFRLGVIPKESFEWNFWGSVFYAGTLTTTIGYGTMTPVTMGGKIVTILFATTGIPLVLYTINQMGKLFGLWMWKAYLIVRVFLIRRLGGCGGLVSAGSGRRDEGSRLSEFPFGVAVGVTAAWTLGCSLLFCTWEKDWTLFDSFYFFFQSLTTIGLGDVTPRHTNYMVWSFILILIGLALFSMCWTLAQLKLDAIVNRMKARIRSRGVEEMQQEMESEPLSSERKISKAVSMVHMEHSWLATILSDSRKLAQDVIAEWEEKARMRNRSSQTERLHTQDTNAQWEWASCSVGTQAALPDRSRWGGFYAPPPLPSGSRMVSRHLGQRSARTRSSDEARDLFSEMGSLLDDCVQLLSDSGAPSPAPASPKAALGRE